MSPVGSLLLGLFGSIAVGFVSPSSQYLPVVTMLFFGVLAIIIKLDELRKKP